MNRVNDNGHILRPLLRGLPIIFITTCISFFIAKMYLKYATPEYESTAKIKMADIHDGVSNSNLFKDFDVFATSNKIGAEVELLKSKTLVRKVIEKLPLRISIYRVGEIHKTELYTSSPFKVEAIVQNKALLDSTFTLSIHSDSLIDLGLPSGKILKGKLNKPIYIAGSKITMVENKELLARKPNLQLNDRYEFVIHSDEKLTNNLIDGLDVMPIDKDIPVLRISFKCPVAQKSADVVNTLSAVYITDFINEKYKSADTTEVFLNKQLNNYSHRLSSSENAIANYRDQNNIINIPQETETDLRKIADLKKELAGVKMNLNAVDSLDQYIVKGKNNFLQLAPNFEAFTDLLSTELIKKAKDLQQEKSDLLLKYTPEHEKVKVIDEKLKDISDYMEESVKNTKNNLRIKYNDLDRSIKASESVFNGLPGREKQMTILDRNFGLDDQVYRFLQGKRTEAEIAKAATISFHRVISEGEVSDKPVSPNVTIIRILSVMLGALGGIVLIYVIHALKGRVNNEDTINRLSDLPIAASVPYMKRGFEQVKYFKSWVLQMELKAMLNKGNVLLISSYDVNEGDFFISKGLKRELEQLDKKSLYMDAKEIIAGELERPENWKTYLKQLRKEYDVILIKNFTLNESPSSLMLMANADLNFLVLDSRRSKKATVSAVDLLQEDLKIPNLQFVLNRAGYNPNLFAQFKKMIFWIIKKQRK